MACRVSAARAVLTDRVAVHRGVAEIKASTRISEASDTLASALSVSEAGAASLSLTLCTHTVTKEAETKVCIYCNTDTKKEISRL